MTGSFYKPSGKLSGSFFLYYLLVLLIGVPILSTIYVYLIYYVPIIYANLLITLACGGLLGLMVGWAAKRGNVRNPFLVLLTSFLAVCALIYVSWAIYIPLIFSEVYLIDNYTFMERFPAAFALLLDPAGMLLSIETIHAWGVWVIGDGNAPINNGMLTAVWAVEFILLTSLAIGASWKQPRMPFSEESGEWYVEREEKIQADMPPNFDSLKNQMVNRNFTDLFQLVKTGRTDPFNYMSITVFEPSKDFSTEPHYLTIEAKTVGKKDKETSKTLVKHMLIDTQNARELFTALEAQAVEDETAYEQDEAEALAEDNYPRAQSNFEDEDED